MNSRINRAGIEQKLLAVWIDSEIYTRLERMAAEQRTTVADLARMLLPQIINLEADRDQLLRLAAELLDLAQRQSEHLAEPKGGLRIKERVILELRRLEIKRLKESLSSAGSDMQTLEHAK